MSAAVTTGALVGLKVIDLSRVLGGPLAAQILGDHGADVIKVEPPAGDETREWGPPFQDETASYFLGLNRNKRAIALDLRQQQGRDVLLRLLEGADVLVENFKPGTLEGWGLDFETVLAPRFPQLIQCRISGFGSDGPLGGMPGYDAILQAMGGIMSVNGTAGGDPTRVGLPVVDMVTGLNAVIGVLLALQARHQSGRGQFVDATLFDSAISLLHPHAANHMLSGALPQRTGNDHPNIAPYSTYRTGSCPIYLAVGNDRQFARLCAAVGAPDLAKDSRFRSNRDRVIHRDALRGALEAALAAHDGVELADRLLHQGVPAGPVLDVAQSLRHPHTVHRGMTIEIDGYRGLGAPVRPRRSPPGYRLRPPGFAEHTADILRQHGFSDDEVTALETSEVTPTRRRT
ncbi:CoA transferase [Tistrella mobilis]|uniref:Carnitine dehydratase n=1 Tax=Tistrella mobilis TaxID=171437 RepID=A0A162JZZ1_9PROT|nr:CoA transferase [Tistrella mobilis]KYO50208.1 carnitine dehydratase [Tistrella mobilis]